jgi:hypothetical protein
MSEAQRKAIRGLGKEVYDAYKKHGHTGPDGGLLNMSPNAQDGRFLAEMNKKYGTNPPPADPIYTQNGHVGPDGKVLSMTPQAQDDRFLAEFNRKNPPLSMTPQAQDDRFIAQVQNQNPNQSYWTRKKNTDRGGQQ